MRTGGSDALGIELAIRNLTPRPVTREEADLARRFIARNCPAEYQPLVLAALALHERNDCE